MLIIYLFISLLIISLVYGMPYRVPLQGIVGGKETLVILDNMGTRITHSVFFEDLKNRGHNLIYKHVDSPELQLKKFEEYLYNNIILFAPTANDFNTITFQDIYQFVEDGGNLIFGGNNDLSANMRKFAAQCGIEFDKKGSVVIDHYNSYDIDDIGRSSAIVSYNHIQSSVILGDYIKSADPILYKGIGHTFDDSNVLALKILTGNPTSYSSNPISNSIKFPDNVGPDLLLISALQARNNARLLFSGSIDIFSNNYYNTKYNNQLVGNRVFINELNKWILGESGVLRFYDVIHHKTDGTPPDVILHEKQRPDLPQTLYPDPEITRNSLVYRIKDDIVFSIRVEELKANEWIPFQPNDMQMEFVMLDPYVRTTLNSTLDGKLSTVFTAPDSYGVFKFRVFYRRPGYSVIHSETQVSIRPFKHNEYERFILSAYPYYTSAISAVIAFIVFSISFLYSTN